MHTPGPWEATRWYDRETDQGGYQITVNGRLLPMCDMDSSEVDDPEANARLIASAPDLLEALQAVLSNCLDSQGLADAYKQARAAIAKATGEQ